jgi:hypothetical protein
MRNENYLKMTPKARRRKSGQTPSSGVSRTSDVRCQAAGCRERRSVSRRPRGQRLWFGILPRPQRYDGCRYARFLRVEMGVNRRSSHEHVGIRPSGPAAGQPTALGSAAGQAAAHHAAIGGRRSPCLETIARIDAVSQGLQKQGCQRSRGRRWSYHCRP